MTTFTTEDRIFTAQYFTDPGINDEGFFTRSPWPNVPWANAKDYRQTEIEFFFPLTEQIPLDLDYGPTHLHFKAKGIAGVSSMPIKGSIHEFTTTISNTTWSTNISPTLSVKPQNSIGQLNIGGVEIGLENEPKWYSKLLYKLLGFNWKK